MLRFVCYLLITRTRRGQSMTPPYVDARYATVNHAAGDQLNIINTTVNREFFILLLVYLVSDPLL